MMRWLARAATVLTACAVAFGPPLLAGLWLLHRPWPRLTADAARDWLQQPRTPPDIITGGAIAAAVLLWLLLLGHLTRRGLHALHRRWRRLRDLPLPTPAQVTVGSMAGVAALTLPAAATTEHTGPPAATGTPPPADPTEHGHPSPAPDSRTEPGIDLPGGGWMPYRTAALVTALAATGIWVHRRRTYRPDLRRLGTHDTDPDLRPLPGTAQAITVAFEETARPRQSAHVLSQDLPVGVLHLHGPGASAAARGLLVTAAFATTPATRTLAIRHEHRHEILPGHDDHALAALGIMVQPCSEAEQPAREANGVNRAGMAPTAAGETRAGRPARPLTVLAIGGGTATAQIRWHVAADGTTTGTGITTPRRLCVLDTQAASDLLALVRQQHHPAPRQLPVPPVVAAPSPKPGRAAPARLTLLGECGLTMAGQPVRLRRTAALQILAYLAVHPGGATQTDLITAIWPHVPPDSITQRLHTTLSDLRRQLQPAVTDPVLRHGDTYRLNTDMIETDLCEWRVAATALRQALGDIPCADACRKLLPMYQELAAGQTWPWILPTRETIRRDALDACRFLAEHAQPSDTFTWLTKALAIDPYNTSSQSRAIPARGTIGS